MFPYLVTKLLKNLKIIPWHVLTSTKNDQHQYSDCVTLVRLQHSLLILHYWRFGDLKMSFLQADISLLLPTNT